MKPSHLRLELIALLVLSLGGTDNPVQCQGEQAKIQRLIRKLGSEDFREREEASRDLAAIGEPAEQALRKATRDRDLEIRRRAAELVERCVARRRAKERAVLQGVWVLKTTEYLGEKADQDPADDELRMWRARREYRDDKRGLAEYISKYRTTLTIKGDDFVRRQWITRIAGGVSGPTSFEGTYHLDPDRTPKVMQRSWKDSGVLLKGNETYCIYSVKGDTLLICLSLSDSEKHIPRQFVTDRDEDVVLMTFKREKK